MPDARQRQDERVVADQETIDHQGSIKASITSLTLWIVVALLTNRVRANWDLNCYRSRADVRTSVCGGGFAESEKNEGRA